MMTANSTPFDQASAVADVTPMLSASLPPIEDLFATSAQVTILMPSDRAKAAGDKTLGSKLDADDKPDSSESKPLARPVVAVRGLVPVGRFPVSPNFVDFEIERATDPGVERDGQRFKSPEVLDQRRQLRWTKLDLRKSLDLLEQTEFVRETIPPLLTDPVFTMPLISHSGPWGELATHPLLPLTEPRSKDAVEFRLFRFFDFDVAKEQRLAYRVRLKLAVPETATGQTVIDTPWATTSQWVTVP